MRKQTHVVTLFLGDEAGAVLDKTLATLGGAHGLRTSLIRRGVILACAEAIAQREKTDKILNPKPKAGGTT